MEPMTPPSATLDTNQHPACLRITGDWTLAHYASLKRESEQLRTQCSSDTVADLSQLGRLDTAGASLLAELLGSERLSHCTDSLPDASRALLKNVYCSVQDYCIPVKEAERPVLLLLLERIGRAVNTLWQDTRQLLGFVGLILETLLRRAFQPHRWRLTPVVAHIEQTGLDAAPIVALLTFLVGAVVAFLGATVLAAFGATIFTVDLVAFSFLREFAVLLTAILMAGRTASAFTAQIGSMKANEEIDAIRTLGLNPMELLVVPRVLALLISLPLLTFLAMICGIVGGAVVCALSLDISPAMFLSLLQTDIGVQHFLVGLAKAPFFAFLIAAIGCLEGFKVSGSAESVGAHTTSAVVQSIFVVIVLDAVAALFFMEMGW
ncbi:MULTISPECIES: MlaE family lipid ABC transporter permease subunit [unclassified Pseudomonas]|uniref:ABC transporter permease n=1 Tax=unclassified Pseudomonas TaxID=196821 RepID=UPI000A0B9548|nr:MULTISPECIES: MlaE family lipid ABC transporter permease subunit [unclassified Pseudomonas]MCX2688607.1 MlaE family lipid ABC transporter permease subunit [Pseudomonas sp. DCB_AW]SME88168.1 phospholipid/cholesterol/gamma-HCH transport system permease protein [Pseudomonas sp. LAIL14HWK12:I11]SMR68041.1 phospholipid/cholesterol/gamma-HCH transport system permease protein [Pseudomonas sp. LAIL14HWK12:I10]SOD00272.1 phospholipid/cholesterol/gamma-HCH transport system permease protein [Pseudomona